MDDDHLRPLEELAPEAFRERLASPASRAPGDLAGDMIRIGRVRVREKLKLGLGPFAKTPVEFRNCVFDDLELHGSDDKPTVSIVECGVPKLLIFNPFLDVRVTRSNVGEAQIGETLGYLALNGRAERTILKGPIGEIRFDDWSTERLLVQGLCLQDCRCQVTGVLDKAPLTVRAFAETSDPAWARMLHLLCPTTPILFTGNVGRLADD